MRKRALGSSLQGRSSLYLPWKSILVIGVIVVFAALPLLRNSFGGTFRFPVWAIGEFSSPVSTLKHRVRIFLGERYEIFHPQVPVPTGYKKVAPKGGWLGERELVSQVLRRNPELSIQLIGYQNPQLRFFTYQFDYLSFEDARRSGLARQLGLHEVISSGRNSWEKFLLLRDWVFQQWIGNTRGPRVQPEPVSAFEILQNARGGESAICSLSAKTFLQAVTSVGLQARYVQTYHHVTTEIWSDRHGKWVLMDAYFNAHVEKDGVPQNVFEMYQAFHSKRPEALEKGLPPVDRDATTWQDLGMQAVFGKTWRKNPAEARPVDYGFRPIRFSESGVVLRNDFLGRQYPPWHPKNFDYLKGWLYYIPRRGWKTRQFPSTKAFQTSMDIRDFYWTLSQTQIYLRLQRSARSQALKSYSTPSRLTSKDLRCR